MTEQMEWQAPPPRHRYDWPMIQAMLRQRPGEWLKVFDEGPTSIAVAIRQQSITTLGPMHAPGVSGVEVRTRNNTKDAPRMCTLFVRWVEEGGTSAATDDD